MKYVVLLLFLISIFSLIDKIAFGIEGIIRDVKVEMVAKLTGIDSINGSLCEERAVYGCDLGHMFEMGNRIYFVFGDTFGKDKDLWRSNIMAFTSDINPSDGIIFDDFIWAREESYYEVEDNNLRIHVAKGSDFWMGIDKTPKFLKFPTNDNWSIELKISKNEAMLHGIDLFGLIIFKDENNWLLWGYSGSNSIEASGTFNRIFKKIISLDFSVPFLRISKQNNRYLFYYSKDGKNWIIAGEYLDYFNSFSNARYGLGGMARGQNDYDIFIEYFSENDDLYYFQKKDGLNKFLKSFIPSNFTYNLNKYAKELIHRDLQDTTVIPTNGVTVGNKMYLFFMAVKKWGEPGYWETNYSGIAVSEDGGWTWKKLERPRWEGNSNFAQVAIYKVKGTPIVNPNFGIDEGDILIWGIPAGRFGGVKLMKVNSGDLENPSAYLYFAGIDEKGNPEWSKDEKKALLIIDPPVGECSIIYNRFLERWIITYLNEKSHNIEIREALYPWGPWSTPLTLVSAEDYPGLYGAFMHPLYVENQGEIVYFTMSLWESYNVYWMKVKFIK
jgi:regulation of enolase protein 1 (concanavalin A-like superfamily)